MEPLMKTESLFRPWELEVKLQNERRERENSEVVNVRNYPNKETCREKVGSKIVPVARIQCCSKRVARHASDSELDSYPLKKPRFQSPDQTPRTKSLPSHHHNYGSMDPLPSVRNSVGSFNLRLSRPSSFFIDPRHPPSISRVIPAPESHQASPLVDAVASGPSESARRRRPKDKVCPKCPNTFSNQAQLDAHLRGHFNVRNYACDYVVDGDSKKRCDKRFVRKEELTRHQRTHTGEKPHLCRMCGKGFGRKDHLQKHEKTHEKTGPPQPFPFSGSHPPGFLLHSPVGGMPPYPLFPLHPPEMPVRMPPPGYMLNLLAYPKLFPVGLGGDGLLRSVSAGFPSRRVRSPKTEPELSKA